MLINQECKLKGQFNIDHQWHVHRTMVGIIWEVRISEGQIIQAILQKHSHRISNSTGL